MVARPIVFFKNAASGVCAHCEFLNWNVGHLRELSEHGGAHGRGGVALVGVVLDDEAAVDPRRHAGVVLGGVVRVQRVGHVDRHDHALAQGAHQGACGRSASNVTAAWQYRLISTRGSE